MQSILVAGRSQTALQRGLSLAADLSVASGARLFLAYVPNWTPPADGTDRLVETLFLPQDPRSPMRSFSTWSGPEGWLGEAASLVTECWTDSQSGDFLNLIRRIERQKPDVVIAAESGLARALVGMTDAPVWRLRKSDTPRQWFSIRRLRCAAHGERAAEWAARLARAIGADLEFADRRRDADVAVLPRGLRPLVASLTLRGSPLVVV